MSYWKDFSKQLPNERWEYIPKTGSDYMISDFGRIKSLDYWGKGVSGILSQREAKKGSYLKIDLDKYNFRPSVHRLVALTFIPNPENKKFVNHKDGNKQK